jgi:hypothetical protein
MRPSVNSTLAVVRLPGGDEIFRRHGNGMWERTDFILRTSIICTWDDLVSYSSRKCAELEAFEPRPLEVARSGLDA